MRMNLLDLPRVQAFPVFQTNLLAPKARCSVEEDKVPPDVVPSIRMRLFSRYGNTYGFFKRGEESQDV